MNLYTSLGALGALGLIWLAWYAWVITRTFKAETSEFERAIYEIEQETKLNVYDWLRLILSFAGFYQAFRQGALFSVVDGKVDAGGFIYLLSASAILASFLKKTKRTAQNTVLLHLVQELKGTRHQKRGAEKKEAQ